jgi:hypothetical protein
VTAFTGFRTRPGSRQPGRGQPVPGRR